MGKLTANGVKSALGKPGVHQDGDGLFLKVDRRGGASWKLRVQHEGERRDYSIGSANVPAAIGRSDRTPIGRPICR